MALTISIRFLTGRAHLHHWQAHHSDGKVDWPPSPWRLLRALVAVAGRGLTTLPYPDDMPPAKQNAPVLPLAGLDSLKKRGVPDSAKGKLAYSKAKGVLSLKETLTDAERGAFKTANPDPEFAHVLDRLHEIAAEPAPQAMADIEQDEIPLSRLAALLACLAPAPDIWLPRTSGGHTRQFFPIHENGMVKNSGSAVFDTFAMVDKNQPIYFSWPDITFNPEDQRLKDLNRILQRLTYFGRAESWCESQLHTVLPAEMDGVAPGKTHWRCVCIEDGERPDGQEHRDYTLERKLAALTDGGKVDLATEARNLLPRTNKLSSNRPKEPDAFAALLEKETSDTLLLRCLLRESGQDMKDGLERPIGSRWVHYAVPRVIYDLPRPTPRKRPPRKETAHVVRYALNTASVHRPVLPPLTDTLLVADKFRSAVLALHGAKSRNLSGHDENGKSCLDHDHAYWWPTDEDNDGFIDHVTVYCPAGFESTEVEALRRLVRIRQRGGRPDLLVTPVYVGTEDEFPPWQSGTKGGENCATSVFISATPYFCPVHLSHGRNGSGRVRPITREILKGMWIQGIISEDAEVRSIQELVFDYAPAELKLMVAATAAQQAAGPVPPRQFFPIVAPPTEYPPLPRLAETSDLRFVGAVFKDPDAGFPFGLSVGLRVNKGTRFIRALSFTRRRRSHEVKGYGRMFRIEFEHPVRPRPFAVGDQCHFGFGLFVPTEI